MFSETAHWYDALYSFKDYRRESEDIINLLKKEHPEGMSLLDVACGTAEHDRYLSRIYNVNGLDINPEFIDIASQKNPEGQYFIADMTNFKFNKKYDIILCLFSSIGYVKTLDNVIKTLRCFKKHLNRGGVAVVEPWFTPEQWNTDGTVHMFTGETAEGKICRMNISERKGSLSIIDFHYLVGTSNGVQHITERHELGLFSVEEMKKAFKSAGLIVTYDKDGFTGRGMYIARKE
jgi:ubiquinone/menaquinone biosynthesis C-methylase UbiE